MSTDDGGRGSSDQVREHYAPYSEAEASPVVGTYPTFVTLTASTDQPDLVPCSVGPEGVTDMYMISNLIEPNSRPELRSPPPLTPEGQVVTPEPEKTFLQKYWIYILAVMVVLGQFSPPLARTLPDMMREL